MLPLYYASLELPNLIVNCAIEYAPTHFHHPIGLFGAVLFDVDRIGLLFVYCALLLAIYDAHGAIKFRVNVYKSMLGERMILLLRRDLFGLVLRRQTTGIDDPAAREAAREGSLVSIITTEVEPLSGFFSEAVATPLMEGGLLLTAFVFVFVQNALLGAILLLIYPLQLIVIPRLQIRQTRLERDDFRLGDIRRWRSSWRILGARRRRGCCRSKWRRPERCAALLRAAGA